VYIIEPFDPARHDRSQFACGVERIDNYLRLSAKKHQKGDFTRIFVAVREGQSAVAGFYALNAHAVVREDLPDSQTRNAPAHGSVPGIYLSMLGVDRTAQGAGLGESLMIEAFRNVARASELVGARFLMLDVIDDGDTAAIERRAAFYRRLGFLPLPSRPLRMFIPVALIREALAL
jgi:ribosomal protein S18 acetylase RimI-like enzyme